MQINFNSIEWRKITINKEWNQKNIQLEDKLITILLEILNQ